MASDKQNTTALLTEHFRYTPLTLLDDIINIVNELVYRAVNAVDDGLSAKSPEDLGFQLDDPTLTAEARRDALEQLKQNEIDNGTVKLESLLNATVDKDFDKFEIYTLRNILAVGHEDEDLANWVRLEHYKGVDVVAAAGVPTPEEVQMRRRKLHETAKLNTMLRAEEARNRAVLGQLSGLIGGATDTEAGEGGGEAPFAFLQAAKGQNLTQDTQEALSQIPALQELLAKLKDAMQTIPNARNARYDEDSAEGRRRRYLEKQTQRALERKGIDAEGSAGGPLAGGRRMGREEVEGIESVAQALGGAEGKIGS